MPTRDPLPQDAFDAFFLHYEPAQWSQVLLLQGASTPALKARLQHLTAGMLCAASKKPCGGCKSCLLVQREIHPDCLRVTPEKKGAALKIESIRALMEPVYLSPQLGGHRVVILHPAERMTPGAANALLKLLEEPPSGVYFILVAAHLNGMLPTLLSRCQIWPLQQGDTRAFLEAESREDDAFARVWEDRRLIFEHIALLLQQKESPYSLASQWVRYELYALCRLLYWLYATLIAENLGHRACGEEMALLSGQVRSVELFSQLDKINAIVRRINQGIAMNHLLVLEDFLSFSGRYHA